jgi:sugar-specific transcriptional regulator TrmB
MTITNPQNLAENLMFQDEEYVQTLMGLGLTLLQAKTYFALAKLGVADVKTISKVSNVARQDVYRVTPKLQKRGLVEKLIATPTLYKAIPLKAGLSTLLQQKVEEDAELQGKTEVLISNFEKKFGSGMAYQENDSQFIITSEETLFRKRISEATDAAQTSKDAIVTLEGFRAVLFHHMQHLKNAINRGVKIRIITEQPRDMQSVRKIARDLKRTQLFECKYTSAPTPICMMIFDNKEVNLRMAEGAVPSFWSNNPNIVSLSRKYFDELWSKT